MDSYNIESDLSGSTPRSFAHICLAAILAAFMLTFAVTPKATTQGSGPARERPATDVSGCNAKETKGGPVTGDCHPTTSEMRANGWRAKMEDQQWTVVADNRILREHDLGAARVHLCFNYDGVLCLVLPSIGT
jgi:hypothetical protein